MNEEYEEGLRAIGEARASIRLKGIAFISSSVAASLFLLYVPILRNLSFPVFVLILLLLIPSAIQQEKKRRAIARIPCPRCHKPFGWTRSMIGSWNDYSCQNCDLRMNPK